MPPNVSPSLKPSARHFAFTLVELLVVLAILAVLAALLVPLFGHLKIKAQGSSCLNNLSQLQTCWQMYVNDHKGLVPPNVSEFSDVWRSTPGSWISNSSALYDSDTKSIESGLLIKYDPNHSMEIYRCPTDQSRVRPINGMAMGGFRTRSYSMSGCFGGRTNDIQKTVSLLSAAPNPAGLFVFIDENEDSIDDGHFLTWPRPDSRWVNMPADRHNQSGAFSFADGHVELWHWASPKNFKVKASYWKEAENEFDLADLRRLQDAILPVDAFVPQK